jgi:hypothetical protein
MGTLSRSLLTVVGAIVVGGRVQVPVLPLFAPLLPTVQQLPTAPAAPR